MTALAVTNPTLSGTMDATLIQQNYTDCLTYLNASVLRKDGTVAMAAALSTNNADPIAAGDAVRKAYRDGVCVLATGGVSTPYTTAGVWATMFFTTKNRDGTNGANASSNYNLGLGIFTAPTAGVYRFEVGAFNTALTNDTAIWNSRLLINSGTVISGPCVKPSAIGGFTDPSASFSVSWYMNAGDTAQPQAKSTVGYLPNQTFGNHFMVAWVHA